MYNWYLIIYAQGECIFRSGLLYETFRDYANLFDKCFPRVFSIALDFSIEFLT